MTPLVTVGIPSYNHAAYLPHAIESVLGQTLTDVELVIADDGSTDGSLEIAQRYAAAHPGRVTVLTHPGQAHRGTAATGNLHRSHASGRFLLALGSDDALHPDALERGVEYLEARPETGFVYGYAHRIDGAGRPLPGARRFGGDVTAGGRAVERLVQGNKVPFMTALFRRECVERAGPEHEEVVYADWELLVRIAAHCEVGFIPRVLAVQRVHGANTSVTASRETNVGRAWEVTAVLRERARAVGGRLAEPRVLAVLELQTAFLGFASERDDGTDGAVRLAFEHDPELRHDARWLADWVWDRIVDELLPHDGPLLVDWLEPRLAPLLDGTALGRLERELRA
ncbi:MAG: glycosyltransferase, partial [Actinomycetota bacterium]|nr:glycosyltransferase [Actinomycetota bacterium]